jgi:hypothetical protein
MSGDIDMLVSRLHAAIDAARASLAVSQRALAGGHDSDVAVKLAERAIAEGARHIAEASRLADEGRQPK